MRVYTVGYENSSLFEVIDKLERAGVSQLWDIRRRNQRGPLSKSILTEALKTQYREVKSAAPSEELLLNYRRDKKWIPFKESYLEGIESLSLQDVSKLKGVCFLCYEANAKNCHRSLLTEWLGRKIDGLEVVHL